MSFFILVTCLSLFCWAKFSFNVWIFAQSCIHLKSIFIDYVLMPCAAHCSRCIFFDLEFIVSGRRTTQVPSTVLWKSFMGGEKKKEYFRSGSESGKTPKRWHWQVVGFCRNLCTEFWAKAQRWETAWLSMGGGAIPFVWVQEIGRRRLKGVGWSYMV